MGVYAETSFEITCDSTPTAEKVIKELKKMKKESDENLNFNFNGLSRNVNTVFGEHSSNRIQNLEWQCEQIWERVKDIKGVLEANFPFMVEDNGCLFSNDK